MPLYQVVLFYVQGSKARLAGYILPYRESNLNSENHIVQLKILVPMIYLPVNCLSSLWNVLYYYSIYVCGPRYDDYGQKLEHLSLVIGAVSLVL